MTKPLNPILALAGAASDAGLSMFARELLGVSRGNRDAKAIRKSSKRYTGFHVVSVAVVVNRRINCGKAAY